MTEKRFTLDNEENGLCKCILMNGEEIPTCEVVELLNKLSDENEQLKIKIEDIELELENTKDRNDDAYYELYQVKKKNEQLKQQLSEQGIQIDFLSDENTHMRNVLNENKQLKEEIKDLNDVLARYEEKELME